jgi:hypothetical protein
VAAAAAIEQFLPALDTDGTSHTAADCCLPRHVDCYLLHTAAEMRLQVQMALHKLLLPLQPVLVVHMSFGQTCQHQCFLQQLLPLRLPG